jgi:hypothetical protein
LISSSYKTTARIRRFPKWAYRGIPVQSSSGGLALASSLERATGEMENGQPEEGKMSETMVQPSEGPEIAEQKLWRAVIAKTVGEWILGPLRWQREAEQFLFRDEDDFYTVCFSAGMNPRYLRDRLKKFRAREGAEAQTRASRN